MTNIISSSISWLRKPGKIKLIIGGMSVLIIVVIGYAIFTPKNTNNKFVTVEKGSITEVVSVTGNTQMLILLAAKP